MMSVMMKKIKKKEKKKRKGINERCTNKYCKIVPLFNNRIYLYRFYQFCLEIQKNYHESIWSIIWFLLKKIGLIEKNVSSNFGSRPLILLVFNIYIFLNIFSFRRAKRNVHINVLNVKIKSVEWCTCSWSSVCR